MEKDWLPLGKTTIIGRFYIVLLIDSKLKDENRGTKIFFLLFPPNKKKKTVVHNFTDFTPAVRRIIFCRTTRTTNRRVPDKLPTTENRLKIAVEKAIFSRKLIFFYLFFTHIYNIISGTIYDLSMFRTIRVCTRGRGIMNVFVHSCVRKHILSLSLSK